MSSESVIKVEKRLQFIGNHNLTALIMDRIERQHTHLPSRRGWRNVNALCGDRVVMWTTSRGRPHTIDPATDLWKTGRDIHKAFAADQRDEDNLTYVLFQEQAHVDNDLPYFVTTTKSIRAHALKAKVCILHCLIRIVYRTLRCYLER